MGPMKAYATFDLYLVDQSAKNQRIIRALRTFMKRSFPKLTESVKWGNGCWLKGNLPVAYVYSDKEWVQFGFTRGSALKDPRGLLEGDGQYVRHVKVRDVPDIDAKAFAALARQAEKLTLPIARKSSTRSQAGTKPIKSSRSRTRSRSS
jgi:hypothetical protein